MDPRDASASKKDTADEGIQNLQSGELDIFSITSTLFYQFYPLIFVEYPLMQGIDSSPHAFFQDCKMVVFR